MIPFLRSHTRLYPKIDEVCVAAGVMQKSFASGNLESVLLVLRLNCLGFSLEGLPRHIKYDVMRVISNHSVSFDFVTQVHANLKRIDPSSLTCQRWLQLHDLFCFRGRYPLAQTCRMHAQKVALKPVFCLKSKPPISWRNTISAAIETGECKSIEKLDSLLSRAKISGAEAEKWRLFLMLMSGDQIPKALSEAFDNTEYSKFIQNQNVAIVGPAPTQSIDAVEIDASDVVIRMNHSYQGKSTDQFCKGLRTDVSCFSSEQKSAFLNERHGILPAEITWACFKGANAASVVQTKNEKKYCRSFIMFEDMNFHGALNMIPLVALDLACFQCAFIKIFHADLMLTAARVAGYYPESLSKDGKMKSTFRRGSISHDPTLQYLTLNKLWRNKKLSGDQRFEQVMEMGLDNYLVELEKVYA